MKDKIVELTVEGMTCNHCASGVNKMLQRKGMTDVYVNFATKEVRYKSQSDVVSVEEVKSEIEGLGFNVLDEEQPSEIWWTLNRKLIISAILTFPLLMGHIFMASGISVPLIEHPYVQFALCLPVMFIGTMHFGRSAWHSIRSGMPNMDVLIFIGSTAAFIYSIIGTVWMEHDYIFYETAAMIITLVLLGNWLEARAVIQAGSSVDALKEMQAEKALKILPDGSSKTVAREDIFLADMLRVNEGDKVPADGKILKGTAFLNESMLTGESIPVEKGKGEPVFSGTIVQNGSIDISVTATGSDSFIHKMIDLVKSAQHHKPKIQRLADKIAAIFVPVVLGIALLTFSLSYLVFDIPFSKALMNSIAVLVVSCPCAMGLATPMAVMVGVGHIARNGILIKGGETMETFAQIKKVVFDKTGTLTTARLKIKAMNFPNGQETLVKSAVLAIEQRSSHPLAQSLVEGLTGDVSGKAVRFKNIQERKGFGMEGEDFEGRKWLVGSYKMVESYKVPKGHHIYVIMDGQLMGTFDLEDTLRPEAAALVEWLQSDDIHPVLLSGDRKEAVKDVAERLNIEEFYAGQLPDEKLNKIAAMSDQSPTAMVGDGVNDAAALARSTVGVSLSGASAAAMESAEIVLLDGKLESLKKAMSISKLTLKTIKQNLFWAFAYNIIAIPVAALGFLNPMWAALFMAMSDVVVIGNSIRIRFKDIG